MYYYVPNGYVVLKDPITNTNKMVYYLKYIGIYCKCSRLLSLFFKNLIKTSYKSSQRDESTE